MTVQGGAERAPRGETYSARVPNQDLSIWRSELNQQFEAFGLMFQENMNQIMNRLGADKGATLRQVRDKVDHLEATSQWARDDPNPDGRGIRRGHYDFGEPSQRDPNMGLRGPHVPSRAQDRPGDYSLGWPAESRGSHHLTPPDPKSWANTDTPADKEKRKRSPGARSNEAYQTGGISTRAFDRGDYGQRDPEQFEQVPPERQPPRFGPQAGRGIFRGHGQIRAERWRQGARPFDEPPPRFGAGAPPEPIPDYPGDLAGLDSPREAPPHHGHGRQPLYGRVNLNPFRDDPHEDRLRAMPWMRLDFPKFCGHDAQEWTYKTHRYFLCQQVPRDLWVSIAVFHFEGEAMGWYNWTYRGLPEPP
uniref:Uncharacterized protein n=1 Tax=Nymphaea colorata TaxID=210225 RepID=A0A5K0ZIW4_9MAGN